MLKSNGILFHLFVKPYNATKHHTDNESFELLP
jgi:hypothetical protein